MHVDKPAHAPFQCIASGKTHDARGFLDTGKLIEDVDPIRGLRVYLSNTWIRGRAHELGMPYEQDLTRAEAKIAKLEAELERLRPLAEALMPVVEARAEELAVDLADKTVTEEVAA